jgi:hypothetical protein
MLSIKVLYFLALFLIFFNLTYICVYWLISLKFISNYDMVGGSNLFKFKNPNSSENQITILRACFGWIKGISMGVGFEEKWVPIKNGAIRLLALFGSIIF